MSGEKALRNDAGRIAAWTGGDLRWVAALIGVGTLFFIFIVRILNRWWFQDDAGQFFTIRDVQSPIRFFLDVGFARRFGSGQGVVPMQMLDYWIDVHLPAPMPLMGYAHSLLTALAALVGLFFVIRKVTGDPRLSFAGALVWMLLPSTIGTCIFISTRHYVEGLVFTSGVFCVAAGSRPIGILGWIATFVCAVAAMLSKEIYTGLVPAILLAFGIVRRNRVMVAVCFALGITYTAYRIATVGGGMKYAVPMLGPTGYLKYLVTLPFTFSGSLLAYPLLIVAAWASVQYVREGGLTARSDVWIFAALLAATLFMLYPAAYPVVNSYRQLGTWYRGVFLPNTIVLVWICLLVKRMAPPERQTRLLLWLAISMLPGFLLGLHWWNLNMDQERVEARFVLRYPDRLLFTDDPCWWYLRDIGTWYGVPHARVLLAEKPDMPKDQAAIRKAGTLWSYRNGAVRPDPARAEAYLRGITPTFRGHSPTTPR